jgi:acetyl esterase/lipase
MALDDDIRDLVERVARIGEIDYATVTPDAYRRRFLESLAVIAAHGPPVELAPIELASIEDRTIPGPGGALALRLYRPPGPPGLPGPGRRPGRAPCPILVYCHGGGWVIGDVGGHDGECRPLCATTGAIVVSVDYRLAPEHPFPAALDDCTAAVEWVAAHADTLGGDPARIAIAGDSAGANLAAAVALRLRDIAGDGAGGPVLCAQILACPALDLTGDRVADTGQGAPLMDPDALRWMSAQYLAGHPPTDPYASPLHDPDLTGLPPAIVATAEFDPLRGDALAYAGRLERAGVVVTVLDFPRLVHGFLGLRCMSGAAADATERVWAATRRLIGGD